ncbi:hypothetical protein NBE98_11080 [Clostridium swellfunianum]|nr:hypothetical protein [Clostridium swellfunianum]
MTRYSRLEKLDLIKAELKAYIDNFSLLSEAVVNMAREFEALVGFCFRLLSCIFYIRL